MIQQGSFYDLMFLSDPQEEEAWPHSGSVGSVWNGREDRRDGRELEPRPHPPNVEELRNLSSLNLTQERRNTFPNQLACPIPESVTFAGVEDESMCSDSIYLEPQVAKTKHQDGQPREAHIIGTLPSSCSTPARFDKTTFVPFRQGCIDPGKFRGTEGSRLHIFISAPQAAGPLAEKGCSGGAAT